MSSAQGQRDELELDANAAFAIGTDVNIAHVRQIEPDSFNVVLRAAGVRGEDWTKSLLQIGLRLAALPSQGARQEVSVFVPGEWEPGWPLKLARVTVYNGGWLDDSVSGERHVMWISPDSTGQLIVRRALWARLCHRPYSKYWSSKACP